MRKLFSIFIITFVLLANIGIVGAKQSFEEQKKEIIALYNSNKFEMLLLHGRRRVGKSYLLSYFARLHQKNVVYFTGDKSS